MTNNYNKKNNNTFTANVIGATGLIGKQLVKILLDDQRFDKVKIFVRRDTGLVHPKIEQLIVDFRNAQTWQKHLKGDVLYSALGTTLKKAGSKEQQYEVDFRFNLNFANKAKENGINTYVLVSSAGANSRSIIFYSRLKGELDDAVLNLDFPRVAILRPSILTGQRDKTRRMEQISISITRLITKYVFKKYRPVEGRIVAKAMINASMKSSSTKTIWTTDEIFELAESE